MIQMFTLFFFFSFFFKAWNWLDNVSWEWNLKKVERSYQKAGVIYFFFFWFAGVNINNCLRFILSFDGPVNEYQAFIIKPFYYFRKILMPIFIKRVMITNILKAIINKLSNTTFIKNMKNCQTIFIVLSFSNKIFLKISHKPIIILL